MKFLFSFLFFVVTLAIVNGFDADFLSQREGAHLEAPRLKRATKGHKKTFTVVHDEKKNWFESFMACRKKGLDLASVENEEENQTLLKLLIPIEKRVNGMDFWLSGTNHGFNGTYMWLSSGNKVTYHQWTKEEPVRAPVLKAGVCPGEEKCMEINKRLNNKWSEYRCSHLQFYVCQNRA